MRRRLVERLADETRHLGVVGQLKPGIEIGFQRKLTKQRQAEGVDRRDFDIAQPILEIPPSRGIHLRQAARFAQPLDDTLAHLGGGFPRERDRQDVIGIDAGTQQVDVAFNEHARLPRTRGGLEDDVLGGIDRVVARRLIREIAL